MTVNNKFELGKEVRLKTGPEQKFLVKQITIAVDGSFGYTLACGTSSYFAMEQECEPVEGVEHKVGFQING